MIKRIAKYSGVFIMILLMFPVLLVRSGFIKIVKLFNTDDQNSRNKAVDKFAESLTNLNEVHADAGASCAITSCGCSN